MFIVKGIFKTPLTFSRKEVILLKRDIYHNIGEAARYSYGDDNFDLYTFDENVVIMADFFMEYSALFSEINVVED